MLKKSKSKIKRRNTEPALPNSQEAAAGAAGQKRDQQGRLTAMKSDETTNQVWAAPNILGPFYFLPLLLQIRVVPIPCCDMLASFLESSVSDHWREFQESWIWSEAVDVDGVEGKESYNLVALEIFLSS